MMLIDSLGMVADHGPQPLAIADDIAVAALVPRNDAPAAISIANTVSAEAVAPLFDRLALIVIDFPVHGDGRGLTLARRLRRAGFAGRLRAAGPLIADQLADLLACGFDEVAVTDEVAARQPASHWLEALRRVTLSYQRDNGAKLSILDARAAARGAQ